MRFWPRLLLLGTVAVLGACAHSPTYDPLDPLEPVNRVTYSFNEAADVLLVEPVARGYVKVVPQVVRTGVSNFLSNLFYPTVILNDVLQGKFRQAGSDLGRFFTNSTAGVLGFADVATMAGMPKHDEDFGQTLGHWGVGHGWYVVIPFLGPSTNRDLIGRVGDAYSSVLGNTDVEVALAAGALQVLERRVELLGAGAVLKQQFDRYAFVRTAYLEHRRNELYDGDPPSENPDLDW